MKIRHIYEDNRRISYEDYRSVSRTLRCAEEELRRVPAFDDLGEINLSIGYAKLSSLLPVCGRAIDRQTVWIAIDPKLPCYRDPQHPALAITFFHEIHHARRGGIQGCGPGLGEYLASEGLAQSFAHDMRPFHEPYSINLFPDELREAEGRARIVLQGKHPSSYYLWFFGGQGRQPGLSDNLCVKHWTGYSLGSAITRAWLHHNRQTGQGPQTAADAVTTPGQTILAPWLANKFDILETYPVLPRPLSESAASIFSKDHAPRPLSP